MNAQVRHAFVLETAIPVPEPPLVALFVAAGMAEGPAKAVAEILIDADLMGFDTHGLQFVPAYLAALENKQIRPGAHPLLCDLYDYWLARRGDGRATGSTRSTSRRRCAS